MVYRWSFQFVYCVWKTLINIDHHSLWPLPGYLTLVVQKMWTFFQVKWIVFFLTFQLRVCHDLWLMLFFSQKRVEYEMNENKCHSKRKVREDALGKRVKWIHTNEQCSKLLYLKFENFHPEITFECHSEKMGSRRLFFRTRKERSTF